MINPQKPVINPIKNVNRFTALIYIYLDSSTFMCDKLIIALTDVCRMVQCGFVEKRLEQEKDNIHGRITI